MTHKPTVEQASSLQEMFTHFNGYLFKGELPTSQVLCTWTRAHQIIAGHLSPKRWTDAGGVHLYELAINANLMRALSTTDLCAVMVHEMMHLKEAEDGTAGRGGYHKAAFCDAMRAIGIPQIDATTGKDIPAGQGAQSVAQRVADGESPFRFALENLPEEAIPPYESDPEPDMSPPDGGQGSGDGETQPEGPQTPAAPSKPKPGTRGKYSCPMCGLKAWAKHGAVLLCGGLNCSAAEMIEVKGA